MALGVQAGLDWGIAGVLPAAGIAGVLAAAGALLGAGGPNCCFWAGTEDAP